MFLFTLFSNVSYSSNSEYQANIFDFNHQYADNCDSNDDCYLVEDLVRQGLEYGLNSKEKMQRLFQARTTSRIKFGCILPQLSVTGIASTLFETSPSLDLVSAFVGFLFPSRWFEWKASRRLQDAEGESLNTLLANSAQAIQQIYFDVQSRIWSIRILEFYLNEIENLLYVLNNQMVNGVKRASAEDIGLLENIKANITFELVSINRLSAILPELATSIGLDPKFDWATLTVEPHFIMSIDSLAQRQYEEFRDLALELSTEIKNVKYLIRAAKHSKKVVYFDFIDPVGGNDLGLSTSYRIKIARSNIEVLNIALKRTEMQLGNAIQKALNDYNNSLKAFTAVHGALEHLIDIKNAVEENINDVDSPLNIIKIIRYFAFAKGQAVRYIHSYFIFRRAQADLDRYIWHGPIYDLLVDFQLNNLPKIMKEIKRSHSFRRSLKHKLKKIKH